MPGASWEKGESRTINFEDVINPENSPKLIQNPVNHLFLGVVHFISKWLELSHIIWTLPASLETGNSFNLQREKSSIVTGGFVPLDSTELTRKSLMFQQFQEDLCFNS